MSVIPRDDIRTSTDAAAFVWNLVGDLRSDPDSWEAANLEDYLMAVAQILAILDRVQALDDTDERERPTWRTFAEILYAAKSRE